MDKDRVIANFNRTGELIELCFELKKAHLSAKYPELSNDEIQDKLDQGIINRKMKAWESQGH